MGTSTWGVKWLLHSPASNLSLLQSFLTRWIFHMIPWLSKFKDGQRLSIACHMKTILRTWALVSLIVKWFCWSWGVVFKFLSSPKHKPDWDRAAQMNTDKRSRSYHSHHCPFPLPPHPHSSASTDKSLTWKISKFLSCSCNALEFSPELRFKALHQMVLSSFAKLTFLYSLSRFRTQAQMPMDKVRLWQSRS